jgi:sodium transport system permease protein
MTTRNVQLIFLREVRDQLRDRRTLFMVAVLPLLLYPMLGIAMSNMMLTFTEQTRTVAIVGARDLPDLPLIDGDRFVAGYFKRPGDAEKLRVVTDAALDDGTEDDELRAFLRESQERRGTLEELARVAKAREEAEDNQDEAAIAAWRAREEELKRQVAAWFNRSPVEVLIIIPERFRERIAEINARLAERGGEAVSLADLEEGPHPIIVENGANEKSAIAFARVWEALRTWEDKLLEERLEQARLPTSLTTPVAPQDVDLAQQDQLAAGVWSKLFPTLLIIMAVTGAFYPAIDLAAGEKERGTMETLLICPATRTEIVIGKFLTVMAFSFTTALLNLLSMGLTGKHMLQGAGGPSEFSRFGDVSFPPASALIWVALLAVPLAALFSALSLAIATFARSSKEGQYYLTPLLMGTMGLTLFCLNPAVEITPYYSILPVAGPALLLKALLLGSDRMAGLSVYFAPVLISSLGYCVLALWWAIEQFKREDVLFREAERFDLGLWVRHLLRDQEPTPSFTEAAFCFLLILLLQFGSYSTIREAFLETPEEMRQVKLLQLQMIFLVATVAGPAVLMAPMLTSDVRRTLKIRWPSLKMLAVGVVLPVVLLPLSAELLHRLAWFFPELPRGAEQAFAAMRDARVPLWLSLLAFAVFPAVCEELAFRGFILSGMQRSGRPWLPIVLSSVAFGVVHMISQQVFNAMLLGLVLGLLAVRSGSLVPCVVFHMLFNGLQAVLSRIEPKVFEQPALHWLFRVETTAAGPEVRGNWTLLLICGVIAAVLLQWLVRYRDAEAPAETHETPYVPDPARTSVGVGG